MTIKEREELQPRFPAEWEPQEAVMLAWPHELTDWSYMLGEVRECYTEIAKAITEHARLIVVAPDCSNAKSALSHLDQSKIDYLEIDTNDTWARDFGALLTVSRDGEIIVNDFKFNGWGLKFAANLDNMVTRKMWEKSVWPGRYNNCLGFVLEGGSIESDGHGTLLTTSECLLSPNRNGDMSREQIETALCETFGADRVMWLNHGALAGDDTDSHIDTLARLAPDDTILYVGCDDEEDMHYTELKQMEAEILSLRRKDGLPYNCIALPLPDAIYDEDGERLPATYANFLILNDAVLVPIYGQTRKDQLAMQMMKIVFPEHEIIGIDCNALIKQHGSLHCVTMQFPSINKK